MKPEYDFNANINQCIKAVEYIGHTTYVNICNGQHYDVPWGSMTWLAGPCFVLVIAVGVYCSYRVLSSD